MEEDLRRRLRQYESESAVPRYLSDEGTKVAAVMIVVREVLGTWEVLLTRRGRSLRSFPGQVAFPGGMVEAGDQDEAAAALRETREEIGVDNLNIEIVAKLPPQIVGNKLVYSFIGIISDDIDVISVVKLVDNIEVESVFFIPLSVFLSLDYFSAMPFEINNDGTKLQLHFPSFNVSCLGVTTVNNEQVYGVNIIANIFGFTASICIYTAILILDHAPLFDGDSVHIAAREARDVFADMVARQTFILRYFNIKHIKEVSGAKL